MALKRSITIDEKTYPEAYSHITFVRIDKRFSYVYVNTYETEEARGQNAMPIFQEERQSVRADIVGDVYPVAYTYLKTLPEYAGAVDC